MKKITILVPDEPSVVIVVNGIAKEYLLKSTQVSPVMWDMARDRKAMLSEVIKMAAHEMIKHIEKNIKL